MAHKAHRRLGLTILVSILVVAFFAGAVHAGIATSPLGVKSTTVLAGLGSCPLGSVALRTR